MSIQVDDATKKKIADISSIISDKNQIDFGSKSHTDISNKDTKLEPIKKLEMWDSLNKAFEKLGKSRTHRELIAKLPKALPKLFSYNKFSIIIVSKNFEENLGINEKTNSTDDELKFQSILHNGIWVKIIYDNLGSYSKPQFQSLGQLGTGFRK